jgi:hypothetical protein
MGAFDRTAALIASGAIAVLAGCGETPAGELVESPPDSATDYLDDPCSRSNGARLRRFHVTDEGFRPRKVVIRSGTPVMFINCGDQQHAVAKASGRGPGFDSGPLAPRETGHEMVIRVEGLPGQPQN